MYIYPAIIHEEESYWLEFPDLEGCQTSAESLEELLKLAQEALGLYIASRIENGEEVAPPSSLADIKSRNGQTTYIITDIDPYRRKTRAVKKMVSLPEWLAEEAETNGISLSKTLQEALKSRLGSGRA